VRAHVADLVANAPQTLPSYVAMAHATLDRAVTDGRLLPIRASSMLRVLAAAEAHLPTGLVTGLRPSSTGEGRR
jgi:hypothetical protein